MVHVAASYSSHHQAEHEESKKEDLQLQLMD
jgi:hypothetical protein